MANPRTRRIPPTTLNADIAAFAALQGIKDYKPANANYGTNKIEAVKAEMERLQTAEEQAAAELAAARDRAAAKEWEFHDQILGTKAQVEAQYGADSNEIQALGLKKKSERKTGGRRKITNQSS